MHSSRSVGAVLSALLARKYRTETGTLGCPQQTAAPCRAHRGHQLVYRLLARRVLHHLRDRSRPAGETIFRRSLSPDPDRFLEVDCAGTEYPDLKDWRNLHVEFVLFDEASCEMVLRYKKLFQASASWTVCGSSRTNVHAYKIWAHRVRLIVASIRWMEEKRKLSVEDATWLNTNSVYVPVEEPLFADAVEPLADCNDFPSTPSIL